MRYFQCTETACYLQCRLICREHKGVSELPYKCVVDGTAQEWKEVD